MNRGDFWIYVMSRGFVLVGRPQAITESDYLFQSLTDCGVIRVWGTTRGLGQLAIEGPTADTKFDPEPDGVIINRLEIERAMPCEGEACRRWAERTSESGSTTSRRLAKSRA